MARRCRSSCSRARRPSRSALLLIASARALAPTPKPYHVHVGAGKLGLSLVVPALADKNHDFAVLDTPKDPAWAGLLEKGRQNIDVLVNDEHVTTLDFHDGLSEASGASLIVTDDVEALGATLARATTVSCSLGPFLNPVMTHLFECAAKSGSTDKKTLYCCENDHSAVVQLRDELGDRVDVVDCVVDRVSTKRAVDATRGTIRMSCEQWGGVIASLDPRINRKKPPPFGEAFGAEVHAPTSHAAAAFLSDRKLQLVNGMHTTLAFSTMRRFNADEPGDLPLGRPRDFDGGELRSWALARCAGLQQAARALKPGGTLLLMEHVAAAEGTWLRLVQKTLAPILEIVGNGCQWRDTEKILRASWDFEDLRVEPFSADAMPLPFRPHILATATKRQR